MTDEQAVVVATNGTRRLVKIGDVTVEVDLASVRPAGALRIGQKIRLLVKEYDGVKTHVGWIHEFMETKSGPALMLGYLVNNSYQPSIAFKAYTADSGNLTIAPLPPLDQDFDMNKITTLLKAQIVKDEEELTELKRKLTAFIGHFGEQDDRLVPVTMDSRIREGESKDEVL